MKRIFVHAARLLCLVALPLALSGAALGKKPVVGEMAPEAELTLTDGTKIRLSEMRGDVIVLNFWATWCVPCRTELPLLDKYLALQQKHGLRVYAVTTEGSVPEYKLKPLFERLTMQPTRRIKGPYAPIDNAVPTNFVIDRAGRLRYAEAAMFDLDRLNKVLVPLLKEPAPPPAAPPATGQ